MDDDMGTAVSLVLSEKYMQMRVSGVSIKDEGEQY